MICKMGSPSAFRIGAYRCGNHTDRTISSGGSRIFPRGGRQLPKIAIIFHIFAENCMKMKEFGPRGGGARPWRPPLDPPMIRNLFRFGDSTYKARHAHKRLYTVLPKYSKIQVLPGITSCRLMKYNKQAIELNSLLINNMPKDGYG